MLEIIEYECESCGSRFDKPEYIYECKKCRCEICGCCEDDHLCSECSESEDEDASAAPQSGGGD